MGVRIGIDLVDYAEVDAAIAKHGDRYLRRIYGEAEVDDCRDADGMIVAERLAARFAAKEAARKVLRPDRVGIGWRDVQVERRPGGWTALRLTRSAALRAEEQRLEDFELSLTHEAGMAGAVVVAQAA
ncbi:MAG: 4'-phosphopantetheinyl transferase superfamily protein [Baekduia sp.]